MLLGPTRKPLVCKINQKSPLAYQLVGFWPFNENGGQKIHNIAPVSLASKGYVTTAQTGSGVAWGPGKFGGCTFTPNSSVYYVPGTANVATISAPYTLAGWLKATSTGTYSCLISTRLIGGNNAGAALQVAETSGLGTFVVTNGSGGTNTFTSPSNVADGKWHSYVGVVDFNGNDHFYFDGVFAGSTGAAYGVANSVQIGSTADGYLFTGGIDLVGIWNKGFTQSDVDLFHNNPLSILQSQSATRGKHPSSSNPAYNDPNWFGMTF